VTAAPGVDGAGVFGGGPTVIGHRGLGCGVVSGHAENTLGSFTTAVALGAAWVEVDVRRTADDVLVVAHDPAYADGVHLVDLSAAQTDDRGTLRLSALLDELPSVVGVDLDLKSAMEDCLRAPTRTTAGLLSPVAAEEAGRRPVMVSSFDPAALNRLRSTAPQVPLGWLTWHHYPLEAAGAARVVSRTGAGPGARRRRCRRGRGGPGAGRTRRAPPGGLNRSGGSPGHGGAGGERSPSAALPIRLGGRPG
jgi:glycerophosphoryl diester phosphodiesterase